ncbi:MAG: YfhO family protein [Oscillospiraceae bacterium]|jgi:uncharacterized membrane protein YfhO|nr:YfhO family protein [Oscillospiraceae bacterium]
MPVPNYGSSGGARAGKRVAGLLQNNGSVLLAFSATALLTLFIWFCFQIIPFGEIPQEFLAKLPKDAGVLDRLWLRLQHGRTILRMDAFHQYGPLFGELFKRLSEGRSLLYSWNTGLGGNFLGNFFNYLSSPAGLLVLLFGHERVPEAVGVMILLKGAFASGAFAYMLRKMFGRRDASIAAFGVLYSFCGFFIAYYWDVMWIDAMALLPLVALGIDRIVQKQRFLLYSVSLAITLVSNYYMGFMVCIFSVLFYLLRYFTQHSPNAVVVRDAVNFGGTAAGKFFEKLFNNRLLRSSVLFAVSSALAGMLAAIALLPVWSALKSSSATSGDFPGTKEWFNSAFSIFDFLANHLADVVPTIRASGEDVLPNVYSGALTLLLVPLYFFVPSIKVREKALHALALALLFFSFNTRVLNYLWHGNHFPNDLPYRFSFLYSFLLLFIAFRTFQHIKELNGKQILGAGALAAGFTVAVQELVSKNVNGAGRASTEADLAIYLNIAFAVVYALLLFAHKRAPKAKTAALSLLLLCAVVTEVCAADTNNFEISQEKYPFVYDLNAFQKIKSRIAEDDDSFYRMELTDARTRMDPAWYDYPGVSTFSSMAYEKTANLEYRLGLGGNFINSYTYNPQTPVYNAMHSLKYLLETQDTDKVLRTYKDFAYSGSSYAAALASPYYEKRFAQHRFIVYENNYWLPVGYFAKDTLRAWQTTTEQNPFALQTDYWELASGAADVFLPLSYSAASDDFNSDAAFITANSESQYISYSNASTYSASSRKIPLDIYVEQAQNAYIHINSDDVSAVNVYREDSMVENRSHDNRCVWDLGVVQPGQPLRVELVLDSKAPESGGFSCYVYALNQTAFEEGYAFFQTHGWNVTEHSDTRLAGKITTPAGDAGLLYTSIPYDTGWNVTVNGKTVDKKNYVAVGDGAFLAVPLPGGQELTVVFTFVPPGLKPGLLITGGTVTLLGILAILWVLLRRKREERQGKPSLTGTVPDEAQSFVQIPAIPAAEAPVLFGSDTLRPEDFSLDLDPAPLPAEAEEGFRLTLPDPAELEEQPDVQEAASPVTAPADNDGDTAETPKAPLSAQAMLQELQEKTAALQEKVSQHPQDDLPNFRLE